MTHGHSAWWGARARLAFLFPFALVSCGPSEAELDVRKKDEAGKAAVASSAQALATVVEKAGTFGSCDPEGVDAGELSRRWAELRSALKTAGDLAVALPPPLTGAVAAILPIEDDLASTREHIREGKALVPPDLVRPAYEKPEYGGAWYLSGDYRGNYTGSSGEVEGVVVTKGDRYFVVLGAEPAGGYIEYLHGYVEDAGSIITLNVGRSGRDADVVKLTDRETYQEDQESYAIQIAEAKSTYEQELATYQEASRSQTAAVKTLGAALAALETERVRLDGAYADALSVGSRRVNVEFRGVACGAAPAKAAASHAVSRSAPSAPHTSAASGSARVNRPTDPTSPSRGSAPRAAVAVAPFSVKFITYGRPTEVSCTDGQAFSFDQGVRTLDFLVKVACTVKMNDQSVTLRFREATQVSCTIENSGDMSCSSW